MKVGLPLKLGAFVILLFAIVIAACLLWTPLRIKYWVSKYRHGSLSIQAKAVDMILEMGESGKEALRREFGKQVEEADFIIENWSRVNTGDKYNRTPLHWAIWKGFTNATMLLVEKGADLETRAKGAETEEEALCLKKETYKHLIYHHGWQALHFAATVADRKIINLLLDKGTNINSPEEYYDYTPLHLAIYYADLETLKLLVSRGANIEAVGADGSPLNMAIEYGRMEIVRHLVDSGAPIVSKAGYGEKPLLTAAFGNHPKIVSFLIDRGADIDARIGSHSYSLGVRGGTKPVRVEIIITGGTALHAASIEENPKIVKVLLKKGLDVNAKSAYGWTALHIAAKLLDADIIQLLIDGGANVNATTTKGETPLDVCNDYISNEVKNLLVKYGGKTGEELLKNK